MEFITNRLRIESQVNLIITSNAFCIEQRAAAKSKTGIDYGILHYITFASLFRRLAIKLLTIMTIVDFSEGQVTSPK
jgi:hypothetical protein